MRYIKIPTINSRRQINIEWEDKMMHYFKHASTQNSCIPLCKSGTSEYMESRSLSTIPPQLIMGEVIEVNDNHVVARCYNEYYNWIKQLVEYGTRVKPTLQYHYLVQTYQNIGDWEPLVEGIDDDIQYTITGYELVYLGEYLGIYS